VNNLFRTQLEQAGLIFSGVSPDDVLVEIIELKDHPWFIGVQFHPEFQSTPKNPHPLFTSFVAAAKSRKKQIASQGVADKKEASSERSRTRSVASAGEASAGGRP
jgi:hypothetical protein